MGQRRFNLVVRLSDTVRNTLGGIRTLRLDAHDGTRVPLEQVANCQQAYYQLSMSYCREDVSENRRAQL